MEKAIKKVLLVAILGYLSKKLYFSGILVGDSQFYITFALGGLAFALMTMVVIGEDEGKKEK